MQAQMYYHPTITPTKPSPARTHSHLQERERHDLELAAALKRYITKLQSSLHIVNSTATE